MLVPSSSPDADAPDTRDTKPPVGADLPFLLNFLEREIRRREMSLIYTGMRGGQLDATPPTAAVLHSSGGGPKPPRIPLLLGGNVTVNQLRRRMDS